MVKRMFVALMLLVACAVIGDGLLIAQTPETKPTDPTPPAELTAPATPESTDATAADGESSETPQDAPEALATSSSVPTEMLLPAATKAWISVADATELEERFRQTQFGTLFEKESLKPFADHIKARLKDWIDEQNVRLNLDVDDLGTVHSGEICFAGVLPEDDAGEPIKGQHGLVFLMDVTNTLDKARELQTKINAELVKRGAEQEEKTINGVPYIVSVIDKPKLFRKKRFNFQAIVNNWMVVTNNEAVFRDMVRRLVKPEDVQPVESLAGQEAFQTVMSQTELTPYKSQIRWYVDPFGYVQLAQQIRDDEALSKVPRDNWAQDLKDNGFDALRGIGGHVAIGTGEHELLHRSFTYAQQPDGEGTNPVFDLFDFTVNADQPMNIPRWVPTRCSSLIMGNWNTERALNGAGKFYDAVIGENKGDFEQMLNDLKFDENLQLDVRKIVSQLDDHFVIASATEEPITAESERMVGGIRIKGEADFVLKSIQRSHPNARIIKLGEATVVEIDSTREPEMVAEDLPVFEFEDDFQEEEPEEEDQRFQLFEKRYFVITASGDENYLLVSNNKDYLRSVIEQSSNQLAESSDYQQVEQALAELVNLSQANWRSFGRLDASLETNYEMMRQGQMGTSQTMLARIINQIAAEQEAEQARLEGKEIDPEKVREQELDGSKLPEDYAQEIAPYLGPSGGVLETVDQGWRLSGCLLRKKTQVEVVQKVDEVNGSNESTPDKQR